MVTTKEMRELMMEYSAKYFDHKLDDFTLIIKDRKTKSLNGRCYYIRKKIELFRPAINRRGSKIAWKEVLIHEMCHGYVKGGHNARFHAVQADVFAREFGITNYKRSRFVHHIEDQIKDTTPKPDPIDLSTLRKKGDYVETSFGRGTIEKIQKFLSPQMVYYFVKLDTGNSVRVKV